VLGTGDPDGARWPVRHHVSPVRLARAGRPMWTPRSSGSSNRPQPPRRGTAEPAPRVPVLGDCAEAL